MKTRYTLAVMAVLSSGPSLGKDETVNRPKVYTDIVACRAIADSVQRLACLDASAAQLEQATEARTVVILDQQEVRKAKRSLFGFAIPNVPFFESDQEQEEFEQIEGDLASVQALGHDKYQFSVKDAGIWQTTEASFWPLRQGQKMKIKRGVGGSYKMILNNGMVRVKRIN